MICRPVENYEFVLEGIDFLHETCFDIVNQGKSTEALSVTEGDFPLTIRNVREGDVIAMRFGHKKLHRFLMDRHIPLLVRKSWPVVVNAMGQVILVPELGCDVNHYSVKPDLYVRRKDLYGV